MRYLIRFSYDGTKFHGFQRQKDVKNVQGTMEKALSKVLEEEIVIKGSGRTDAGVHAIDQCAHFDTSKKITKEDIKLINVLLKKEIIINSWKLVNDSFHARHSVLKKTYLYKVNTGKSKEKYDGYYYQIKGNLNLSKMKDASKLFIGTHDFRNFVSGPRIDYVSAIYKIKIKKYGDIIEFYFTGIGFYRYMVRHLVGALVMVGKEKIDIHVIENMLSNVEFDKKLAVAPPEGLYLYKIKY